MMVILQVAADGKVYSILPLPNIVI